MGYWLIVIIPIDLVSRSKISELTGLLLVLFSMVVAFCVFLIKLSFFSKRLEKLVFVSMIGNMLSFLVISVFYRISTNISLIFLSFIFIFSSFTTPYLFAKIINLVSTKTKIRTLIELFLIWYGGGVFYLILFIVFGSSITFFISSLSVLIGVIIQFFVEIKPKKYTPIQLLPFKYRTIANGNVLGIFAVLALFWSVDIVILKELSSRQFILPFFSFLDSFTLLWIFLSINVLIGIIFYGINKRLNLRFLFFIDYIIVSMSVIIILFWKPLLPVAFLFISTFGITTFALALPDLMDINKGIIGPSFMSFFQILLLGFPFIHILIYFMDTTLSDSLASFLLITIIIAMALISGIKFLPVPVTVEYLIISHKDGIPLYSKGNASKDEKIISGLLTGILTILNTNNTGKIKTIDHGDKKIIINISDRTFGVAVCDRYSKTVAFNLQEIVDLFEAGFDKVLDLNSFNLQLFKKLPPLLVKKIDFFFHE